jgi:hypothetical protein
MPGVPRPKKEVSMRGPSIILLLFFFQVVLPAAAVTIAPQPPPAPAYADGESSADTALPSLSAGSDYRVFRLTLCFNNSYAPSNSCVQVALGSVPDVSASETTVLIAGCDRGFWFVRPQGLTNRYDSAVSVTAGAHTLVAEVRVNRNGVPVKAAILGDRAPVAFAGLSLDPVPPWLNPGRWKSLRTTVRGADGTDISLTAKLTMDGAAVILK